MKPITFKDGKDEQNFNLEGYATKALEGARKAVTRHMGYDPHLLNVAWLETNAIKAELTGFANDLHLKGETGYASLFFCFDASTMQAHCGFDMIMTTIMVPKQDWVGIICHFIFISQMTQKPFLYSHETRYNTYYHASSNTPSSS